MVLVDFLETPIIRSEMQRVLPFESFRIKGEMRAPPLTKNLALVATAFDYLLRFFIEEKNSNSDRVVTERLVAEKALQQIIRHENMWKMNELKYAFREEKTAMKRLIDGARGNCQTYISTGRITDHFLKACIHLAQIDPYFRSEIITDKMGVVDSRDVEDLRNLISVVPVDRFIVRNYSYLNPTFGYGSRLVGVLIPTLSSIRRS